MAEMAYLKGLNETTSAQLTDGVLVLLNNNKKLLIFKKVN